MEVKVLLCVLCLVSANFVNGLSSSETTDVTETCCNHGDLVSVTLDSARSCASAPLPDTVEPEQRETCKTAMISCCEQMFQEKENCNAGLKYSEAKRCGAPQTEIGKTCCEECTFGRWTGESQGEVACVGPSGDEISPTSVFQKTAFYECCLEAARKPEPTTEKVVPTTTPKPIVKRCKQDSCQHTCDDEGGVIRCSCREGYRLQGDKKSCVDINECAEAIDDLCTAEDTVCHNTPGAFKCVPVKKRDVGKGCPAGFKRNVQNQVCDDINECQSPHPPCPKYLCENTIGGYKCGGKPGKPFEETPGTPTEPAPADPMKNEICPPGFRGGEDDECLDIDECEERVDDCQRLSQHCINTHGNFFCQDHVSKRCAPGFQVNTATGICEDIDECEESSEVCKKSEVCVNLPGAYNCKSKISTLPKLSKKTCQEGTRLRPGGRVCEDIDECREGTHLCDQFQNCINTFGAHECRCKNGFELDSSGSCVDIDECAQKLDNCGSGLHCLNVLGSFTCTRQAPSSPRPAAPTTTPPPYYEYEYYDEEDNSTTDAEPLPAAPTTSTSTTTTPRPTPRPTTSPRPITARPTPTTRRTTTQRPTTTPRPTTTSSTTTAAPRRYNPYTERSTPRNYYTSTTRRPIPPPPPVDPRPDDFYPTPEQPPKPERPDERDNRRPEERPEDRRPSYEPPRPVERDHSRPEERPEDRRPSYDPSRPNERDNSRPEDRRPSYEQPRPNERDNRPDERPEDRRPSYEPPRPNEIEHPSRPYNPRRPSNRRPYIRRTTTPAPTTTEETPALNPEDKYCLNGYEKDAYGNCVDINECESGVHVCGNLESCANRDGGYTCECLAGYRRSPDGWCAPAAAPTTSSTTTEAPTTAVTTPERPYSPYSPPQPSPPAPSHQPVACELGFSYDAGVGRCVDIDECAINKDTCSSLEDCVNIQGGYQCVCGRRCRAENEKPTYVPIQPSAHLPPEYHPVQPSRLPEPGSNVITVGAQFGQRGPWSPRPSYSRLPDTGSIVTSCPWGYKLTADRRCLDIDECAKNISECGPEQRCENFYGGYSCQCPAGHKLLGQNSCEDIDECTHGNPCAYNARCINSVGSYRCECSEGFRNAPSNDKVCVDVDECADTPGVCQHGCANSWGGYRCYCKRGYRLGTDNKTCVDVNECEEWSSVRIRGKLCGGECVNEPGSYRCACPAGYRLSEDQRSCVDIDECETGEASCARASDPGYVCQNTRGSYHCHHIDCPSGYRLEARHRCTRIQRSCPISDWSCLQQPSTYSYNFITFVANIYLPSGSVDLFTMHGPAWSDSVVSFEMRMIKVEASGGVAPADLRCFDMRPTGNVCVISLLCPLAGPQVAELELTMSLYQRGMFAGSNVARLVVIVSAYEF